MIFWKLVKNFGFSSKFAIFSKFSKFSFRYLQYRLKMHLFWSHDFFPPATIWSAGAKSEFALFGGHKTLKNHISHQGGRGAEMFWSRIRGRYTLKMNHYRTKSEITLLPPSFGFLVQRMLSTAKFIELEHLENGMRLFKLN